MSAAPSNPNPQPPEDPSPLLDDLRRGDLSFNALAARHNTTPDILALWLAHPAIREQLETTDSVCTWRSRLIAADTLPRAICSLDILLRRYIRAHTDPANRHELVHALPEPDPDSSAPPIPSHESARRAAATLLRIANLRPTPSPDTLARQRAHIAPAAQMPAAPRPPAPITTTPAPSPARYSDIPYAQPAPVPAPAAPAPQSPAPAPADPPPGFLNDLEAFFDRIDADPALAADPATTEELVQILASHQPAHAAVQSLLQKPEPAHAAALPPINTPRPHERHDPRPLLSPVSHLLSKSGAALARAP